MPHVSMSDELGEQVRAMAAECGVSYAALVREALVVLIELEVARAVAAARAGSPRRCVVCLTLRRADWQEDAIAHAQCDQKVAELEKGAMA